MAAIRLKKLGQGYVYSGVSALLLTTPWELATHVWELRRPVVGVLEDECRPILA